MQQAIAERRAYSRHHVHLWAVVRRHGAIVWEKVIIANLSSDGFKMRSPSTFAVNDMFFLELAIGLVAATKVIRVDPLLPEFGCRFIHPLAPAIIQNIIKRKESNDGDTGGEDIKVRSRGASLPGVGTS